MYSLNSADFKDNDYNLEKKISFRIFFSNWQIIIKMLTSILQWFTQSLVYYGISLNTDVLGGNPYFNFLCFSIVELISNITSNFILNRYGRKLPYLINYFLIATSLITIGFLTASEMKWLEVFLVLIAKFCISFNFIAIYVITFESYPTVIRGTALSACLIGDISAATISPLVAVLAETYFQPLPFLIYGLVVAFSGTLFFFVIPETKALVLPESLEDIYEWELAFFLKNERNIFKVLISFLPIKYLTKADFKLLIIKVYLLDLTENFSFRSV